MEIDRKSRYAGLPLSIYRHPSGETYELRELRQIPRRSSVFALTPVDGDRLDVLSARFYRDPLLFWRVADASEHLDPDGIVEPGEPIPIPPNKDK